MLTRPFHGYCVVISVVIIYLTFPLRKALMGGGGAGSNHLGW